jgi:hypothetical protein
MTPSNDLDRRLTDFLADGPSSATERSIEFALDHAAANPRRRDVLSVLRRDPMRSPTFTGPTRVLQLAAALAILVVAFAGGAFVGGVFNRAPVVVPPPIVSPSPAAPSPTPTPAASPTAISSPSIAAIHVDLIEHQGQDASIDITDRSGDLVSAVSGDPGDGGSVEDGKVQVVADATDPKTLVATWTGMPCDTTHTLDIAPDHTLTITRPSCGGDALPVDHALRLTFAAPIDPASVHGSVVTTAG